MKQTILLLASTIFLFGCKEENNKLGYDYFEMSYRGGWMGGFSIRVTNPYSFYFNENKSPTRIYGSSPNSILLKNIDSAIHLIESDSSVKDIEPQCDDCSSIAIQYKKNNRIININHIAYDTSALEFMYDAVLNTIDTNKCIKIDTIINFPTTRKIGPPAPPTIPLPKRKH